MDIEDAIEFHGHLCPGLSLGFRAAKAAEEHFKNIRAQDEELVCIVENKSCSVDAIQVVNGCTFGKGNLIYRDFGKHVYTFFNRGNDKALRLVVKPDGMKNDEEQQNLFPKIRAGSATEEEKKRFKQKHEEKSHNVLNMPLEDLFKIEEIEIKPPEKAVIFQTLICSECGEGMMESRARVMNGNYYCLPCFEKYDI
ncbi:MAG: FmdE family protein [Methanohalophilus sp.]